MITTVLLGLAALFVYLQIGYWLGHLYWWSWHINERKNRILAFLLFPYSTLDMVRDATITAVGFPHVSLFEKERQYFVMKAVTWPFALAFSSFIISFFAAIAFGVSLITGPKALATKIIEWVRARRLAARTRTRVVEESVGTAENPLLTSDDRTRAEEYRRLCKECDDLEGQLAPRKARRAEIEAEDAATHDAFRDLPQEMRLPKA